MKNSKLLDKASRLDFSKLPGSSADSTATDPAALPAFTPRPKTAPGALMAFALPMAAVAIAVRATSPGPAIYWSDRVGRDNKLFRMPKFRSMRIDTPPVATHLLSDTQSWLTPIGGFLRKSSLDELPQLFNVLEGKMSLVGPRPHANAHNEYYRKLIKGYMIRHKVRPGITGWAQVNGCRGETDTVEQMAQRIRGLGFVGYFNGIADATTVKFRMLKDLTGKKDVDIADVMKTLMAGQVPSF